MYKVKRFSKINSNVYQKDYSWIGNLGKKYRRKAIDIIENSIKENQSKASMSISRFHGQTHVNNPKIESKLLREAKKNNARTVGMTYDNTISRNSKLNFNKRSKDLTDSEINAIGDRYDPLNRTVQKLKNARKSNENMIFHPNESGIEQLSHEIGHVMNKNSKNPISRSISNSETAMYYNSDTMRDKKGLLNIAKGYIKGKVKIHEESKTTRKGLGLIKKLGANKDEMNLAKRNLDSNLDAYRSESKLSYLYPLRNTINK